MFLECNYILTVVFCLHKNEISSLIQLYSCSSEGRTHNVPDIGGEARGGKGDAGRQKKEREFMAIEGDYIGRSSHGENTY